MSQVSFKWVPAGQNPFFGDVSIPRALVEIKATTGEWKVFYPMVDTGAVISLFTKSDCDLLGLKLTDGVQCDLGGAFGDRQPVFLHNVEVRIGSETIKSRVAFTERNYTQLLGRIDIMDNFRVSVSGKHKQTIFIKE